MLKTLKIKFIIFAMLIGVNIFAQAPVIGITATPGVSSHTVVNDYVTAVVKAGGIPLLLPATSDAGVMAATLEHVDGVLLTGGVDVDPHYFGEEPHPMLGDVNARRDTFEMLLIHQAVAREMPIFGICRGMQMLNVALGGTLWQDIPSQVPDADNHRVTVEHGSPIAHTVDIEPGTTSAMVMGATTLAVNSRHHQAVREVAPSLKVTGHSPDGIAEMLEGYPDRPILAVQWHPENFAATDNDTVMIRFFKFLVEESRKHKFKTKTTN